MAKAGKYDYDLIIIGSGAGGSVAAHQAVKAGRSVAIVEADLIGGECPNVGCVPTKALLQAAEIYEAAKNGSKFGIRGSTVGYNYPSIKAWKNLAVRRTGTYLGEEMYTSEGISVIRGRAHFLDPHTISVGTARFSAKNFVIAAGSEVALPPIAGLETIDYLTYREAINLNRPPKSMVIVGGGAIGCEFANLFAIFGTKVYIVDVAPRLLAKEDPEAGSLLKEKFETDYSMTVLTNTIVDKVAKYGLKKHVYLRRGKKQAKVSVDEVLIATGKRGAIDMGLENAGVAYNHGMIEVNDYLQTSAAHIYAAGDIVGPYLFTHTATYQSRIVAHNLLHPRTPIKTDYRAVPRCIFTNPEIASVGKTEEELAAAKISFKTATIQVNLVGRANTTDQGLGFVKVIASSKAGVLLGATIASPRAGEMIHELTLAVQHEMKAEDIASTIHAFPTWSEAVRVACNKLAAS